MMLASYTATQSGYQGIANRLIRSRFGGSFFRDGEASHTEVVFEAVDGVDHLMPDGTTRPDANGAVWCASAVTFERLPAWSAKRAGRWGGLRFKRIVLDHTKWDVRPYTRDAKVAAQWYKDHEGDVYDWGLVIGMAFWAFSFFFTAESNRWHCASAAAAAGSYKRPEFYHPALLRALVSYW